MPRKLPWLQHSISATVSLARSKRPTKAVSSDKKRQKKLDLGVGDGNACPPSSLPPSEAAAETFMIDGMQYDDKYRMVEDEFLAVAQQFTVHLHAAEYLNLQKMVRSRNAETISSISRPVTGEMTQNTKRKADSIQQSMKQQVVLQSLLRNKADDVSDESDDDTLPYIGTTLHGLMDSPRRKAISLAKLSAAGSTRAAAGFQRSVASSPPLRRSVLDSPEPKSAARRPTTLQAKIESENSTDDGDDLDAPIPAPKLTAIDHKLPTPSGSGWNLSRIQMDSTKVKIENPRRSFDKVESSSSATQSAKAPSDTSSSSTLTTPSHKGSKSRPSRRELARRRRIKEEEREQHEGEAKRKIDIIPSFF